MKRGYYGIALYEPKTTENIGTILRSAHNFDCDFICTIGARYKKQPSDTTDAQKHIPVFHYDTLEHFLESVPKNATILRCEVDGKNALETLKHPECAIYIFGGEDRSVPEISSSIGVKIDTKFCLNLATTASIFMFHRSLK
jgi:tRNA(Leu) C34 or U34 (ribose-2'-O)-methylase TrmL